MQQKTQPSIPFHIVIRVFNVASIELMVLLYRCINISAVVILHTQSVSALTGNYSLHCRSGDSPSQQYQIHSNGHSDGVSPNSSQLSMEGTMVTRTQKQHVTHNVRQ